MDNVVPIFICLMGVDGSGKTLQAKKLIDALKGWGVSADYVWSRGDNILIIKLLLRAGRWLLRKKQSPLLSKKSEIEPYNDYLSSKDKLFRNPLIRWGWTQVSLFEHWIQIHRMVYPLLRHSQVVIADRYIFDTVVDIAAGANYTSNTIHQLLSHPILIYLQKPTLFFLLDVDTRIAMQRKPDIPGPEYIERRKKLYAELASYLNVQVIDANQNIEQVFLDILTIVRRELLESGFSLLPVNHPGKQYEV